MCEPLRSFVVVASVQRLCATVTSIRALPVAVILNWGGEGQGVVRQSLNSWLGFAQQQKLTFGKLPIVLFVGQHFSGSLFEWIHLSI